MKQSQDLVRGLGLVALIASVFNCTVGGGIFRLPASVYAIVGQASPLVYLICFGMISLIALVFIQLGKQVTVSGGPYAYVQPVFGNFPAYLCGVLLFSQALLSMASVSNAYANFVGLSIPALSSSMGQMGILAVTLAALALFNIRGVRHGAGVSIALSVIKCLPLLCLTLVGLPHLNQANLSIPTPLQGDQLARGAMILIFAFCGIESALIPSGEIKNPEKTLPKALFSALFIVLFLYLGVQSVSQSVLGAELGTPGQFPLAKVAEQLMGPWGGWLIRVGAIFSTLGYLSAITLSLPRGLYALAYDGYLPAYLKKVHPSHQTPMNSILTLAVVAWVLAISNQFEQLALLANVSAFLMFMFCSVAAITLSWKTRRPALSYVPPVLAIVAMCFLLTSVTAAEWMSVVVLIAVSSALYMWKSKTQSLQEQNAQA